MWTNVRQLLAHSLRHIEITQYRWVPTVRRVLHTEMCVLYCTACALWEAGQLMGLVDMHTLVCCRLNIASNNNSHYADDDNIFIYIYIHTHTHARTYVHKYIRANVHIYMPSYTRTYIHTHVHTCLRTHVHTFIHTYIHANSYIYIYACLRTHIN